MLKYFSKLSIAFLLFFTMLQGCESRTQVAYQTRSTENSITATKQSRSTSALQQQFLFKLNKLRAQGRSCGDEYYPGVEPLTINDRLTKAAYLHSLDMSKHQFIDHISSNGDTLVERLDKVNYSWRAIGENVAHNQRTINQVLDDWLSSPGHCSNMMSADFHHTGVAHVNWYWTQVYASPK